MASSAEAVKALETAIERIPEVARIIASISAERRPRAFDAAEHSYLQVAREIGCAEEVAQSWASAIMFRLRGEVDVEGWRDRLRARRQRHNGSAASG